MIQTRTKVGVLLAVTIIVGALGCSSASASTPAGAECSSNADCSGGLSCVSFGVYSDAGCSTGPKACSKTCQGDSDCTSLGPTFMCFGACGGVNVCGEAA
jgi:hypothetical protein